MIDTEIAKLMEMFADEYTFIFKFIVDRITLLSNNKNEYEKSLMLMERKVKRVSTKPLLDPLNKWDTLTMEEKNQLAKMIIDKIYLSKENGIEIQFSF